MKKPLPLRLAALLLVLLMICGTASASMVKSGETISASSKWINSDLIGAIDETTVVSLKDDFHTAVNRDWILHEEDQRGNFEKSEELIHQRKLDIVMGKTPVDPANADAVGLSSQWLEHDLKLVQTFTSLAGEWEERNALGAEPARPYLEAISSISTMDEMTAYLKNENGMNITGFSLVEFNVAVDPEDRQMQVLTISPKSEFTLQAQENYLYLNRAGRSYSYITTEVMHYLLGRLGYEEKEISAMLARGFMFEGRLAENMSSSMSHQTLQYMESARKMTVEEAAKQAGRYPLVQQMEALGADTQTTVAVFEADYLKCIDRLYQPKYLEEIKAACMMQTAMQLISMLDKEAYDRHEEIAATAYPEFAIPDLADIIMETELTEEEKQAKEIFDSYMSVYLSEPMDQIYVAAYCTPELKAEIRQMIDDTILFYRDMLLHADWLSEEARHAAVEKLDNIVIRCVYPDQFTDYTALTFNGYRDEQPGNLPRAVAAIREFRQAQLLARAGQPVDRHTWDMNAANMSTTICNAYYNVLENSINILAGILTEEVIAPDFSYEEKLATVGTIIGHEITHAFDTTGYKFDKDGNNNPWWSVADVEAFDLRANRLVKFYDNLTPYPGAMLYSGRMVSGEAIADMGGVKCMLSIAEKTPDFDYEAFFTAYARIWRTQKQLEIEKTLINQDVHPLGFLRTNVTLQQFEKFHETFDIQPGDGMYLAPEARINVW